MKLLIHLKKFIEKHINTRNQKAVYIDFKRCLLISLVLEFLIFPNFCGKWSDSRYFHYTDDIVEEILKMENSDRQLQSEKYFQPGSAQNSFNFHQKNNAEDLKILTLVITVKREKSDYLLQTVSALDREIKSLHSSDQVCSSTKVVKI